MSTTYRARVADIAADAETLLRLWTANLQGHANVHAHFDWHYLRPPLGPGGAFVLDATADGGTPEPVGCAGIGTRRFYRRGEPLRSALLGDLAVDPSHRTLFPALVLARAVRDRCRESFALTYGFPNAAAAPLFQRLGFAALGPMRRYARILRVDPYVGRHVRWPPLARALAAAPNASLGAADIAHQWLARGQSRLEWVKDVDARFDRLWAAAHASYPILGYRGSDFLRWRYLRRPGRPLAIAALCTGSELEAYAVVQSDGAVAHLRDLFGRDEASLGRILRALFPVLRRRGNTSVSVSLIAPPRYLAVLEEASFSAREATRPVVLDSTQVSAAEEWYLVDGDEDV